MSCEDTLRCGAYFLHWTTSLRPSARQPVTSAPRSPRLPVTRTSVHPSRRHSRRRRRREGAPSHRTWPNSTWWLGDRFGALSVSTSYALRAAMTAPALTPSNADSSHPDGPSRPGRRSARRAHRRAGRQGAPFLQAVPSADATADRSRRSFDACTTELRRLQPAQQWRWWKRLVPLCRGSSPLTITRSSWRWSPGRWPVDSRLAGR